MTHNKHHLLHSVALAAAFVAGASSAHAQRTIITIQIRYT